MHTLHKADHKNSSSFDKQDFNVFSFHYLSQFNKFPCPLSLWLKYPHQDFEIFPILNIKDNWKTSIP